MSRMRMRNFTALTCSASYIERIRASWSPRRETRFAVTPAIRTRACRKHEDVEPADKNGVNMERSPTPSAPSPVRQGTPPRSVLPRRRFDAVTLQVTQLLDDDAHGGQFAVDTAVAPLGLSFASRSTKAVVPSGSPVDRAGRAVGPAVGDQVPVPVQQGRRLTKERSRRRRGAVVPARPAPLSAGSSAGSCTWRRSTAAPAQHDDLDRELGIARTDEADQPKYPAIRPEEDQESHGPGARCAPPPSVKVRLTAHGDIIGTHRVRVTHIRACGGRAGELPRGQRDRFR